MLHSCTWTSHVSPVGVVDWWFRLKQRITCFLICNSNILLTDVRQARIDMHIMMDYPDWSCGSSSHNGQTLMSMRTWCLQTISFIRLHVAPLYFVPYEPRLFESVLISCKVFLPHQFYTRNFTWLLFTTYAFYCLQRLFPSREEKRKIYWPYLLLFIFHSVFLRILKGYQAYNSPQNSITTTYIYEQSVITVEAIL